MDAIVDKQEEIKSENKQEQTQPSVKEIADFIGSVFKAGSVIALMLGGWGMFNYCKDNGVPFPAEIPTLIVTVGIAGTWFAFLVSGSMFLPALGKEGWLGEEYLWLLGKGGNNKGRFVGFVGVPVFLSLALLLWRAMVNDHLGYVSAYVFPAVWFVVTAIMIGITTLINFEYGERLKAARFGFILTLVAMFWSMFALVALLRLLSWLNLDEQEILAWLMLLVLPLGIVFFLYKVMMPEEESKKGMRKKWGAGMGIVFFLLVIHPNLSGMLTGYTLRALKLGGGYETEYVLHRDYCERELFKICIVSDGKTVPLAVMLDTGDRIYVRPVEALAISDKESKVDKENKSQLYMIPMRAVVEQMI